MGRIGCSADSPFLNTSLHPRQPQPPCHYPLYRPSSRSPSHFSQPHWTPCPRSYPSNPLLLSRLTSCFLYSLSSQILHRYRCWCCCSSTAPYPLWKRFGFLFSPFH